MGNAAGKGSDFFVNTRTAKRLIFLTICVDLLGFGIIIPILGPIGANYLPPEKAGLGAGALMAVFSIFQMLCSPFWGRLSDRHGRRPVLLLSLLGSALSYFMFALADSYAVLLLSRILAGVCGANLTAAQAYIADVTDEKDRTAGMGLVGMAFGLGFAFGPVLGGGATEVWSRLFPAAPEHMGAGLAAALICSLNFAWACFGLPESLPRERRGQVNFRRFASTRETLENLRHPAIGPLVALLFLVTFAFANLEVSFSIYARQVLGLDVQRIFGLFIFLGLFMAFVQGFAVRRLVRRVPEARLAVIGIAILAFGLYLFPLHASVTYVAAVMVVVATGQGLCMPPIMALLSREAGEQRQGNVQGTGQSAAALARIVGPVFGGLAFDLGPRWPFWAAAVVMSLAAWWAVQTRRRLRRSALEAVKVQI